MQINHEYDVLHLRPSPTLDVRECDPRDDPQWRAFVEGRADALVFHHPAWIDVLAREYGRAPIGLICVSGDGELRGVLPLFRSRGLPVRLEGQGRGGRLSSLPRTPVAGPLATDGAAAAALLRTAVCRARADDVRLQVKVEGPVLDGLVAGVVGVPWLPTYVRDLPEEAAALRFGNSRNHARITWAVGRAARRGIVVRAADCEEDLRRWYRLYLETMRAHAVPARPYRFFAALLELLAPRGLMRLLLAEQRTSTGSLLLAGSIFLMFGSTVFYAYTGARTNALSLRPNDLVQWHAIHDAVRRGFSRYDLGEVSRDDPGLVEFKRKWGAEPSLLYRYYSPPFEPGSGAGGARRRLGALAARGWRRVPLRATAAIGDRVLHWS